MSDSQAWNVLAGTLELLYYWLKAIVHFFLPPRRKDITGQVVVITGAGSGIGQKLCLQFATLGCTVVGWDISAKGLQQTGEMLTNKNLKSKWRAYKCDITDRLKVYEIAEKVKSDFGTVDILVNNAGIVSGKPFLECRDEMMIKTMEVNAMAHLWTLKAFLPEMVDRNAGHIVTIASSAGLFGVSGLVDYCCSKFAAVGLAEALCTELYHKNKKNIQFTTVCPFFINTGMFNGIISRISPIMTVDDAVDQIVDAVLRNKFLLMMPRILYFTYFLKGFLPSKAGFELSERLGISSIMDTFNGRKDDD